MAKAKRKRAKVDVGLAHVAAALDMLLKDLQDIRLVVGEMRRKEALGDRLSVPTVPGLPCDNRPGSPCKKGPGTPCKKQRPGEPCKKMGPGTPCRKPTETD